MQRVLVDGSQLLLSLSSQLMLLNGSSPPAVNWLRTFPTGYLDGGWHLCFAPVANWAGVASPEQTAPWPLRRGVHLSAGWRHSAVSRVRRLVWRKPGANRLAQHVPAFLIHLSPQGLKYPSKNPPEEKKKNKTRICSNERVQHFSASSPQHETIKTH